jgi:crotonobetainyl-CoA:carnitine CoA-transferase CaiB-like acyl-CoA transferase
VGLFEEVEHPTEGALVQTRLPWTFSGSGAPTLDGAPLLGEHTAAVLAEFGLVEGGLGEAVAPTSDGPRESVRDGGPNPVG